jgi:hypothetical protein
LRIGRIAWRHEGNGQACVSRRLAKDRGTASPAAASREAADISAIPNGTEEPATAPIACCPSALEKLLEVEWRAWLNSGTLPVRLIVQRDPFGYGSAIHAHLDGDISEGLASHVHPFGVDEQGLAAKPALAAYDFMAIARNSRKLGSAGVLTEGCHLPLNVLTQSSASDGRALSRSRILLVNPASHSKIALRKINHLGPSTWREIHRKWPILGQCDNAVRNVRSTVHNCL